MAHTKTGSKAPGYEYWSRRPYNHGPTSRTGRYAKRICHRMERRIAQREVLHELHDL